jgi:hypothetical protein
MRISRLTSIERDTDTTNATAEIGTLICKTATV